MSDLAAAMMASQPVLPHVTWPLDPYKDESLAGFVARTSVHNGLWKPSTLIRDARINLHRGVGYLPRVSVDLENLALILGVDKSWVDGRRHRLIVPGNRNGVSVNFHGSKLRKVHFDYSLIRVGSYAVVNNDYHREIWQVSTLPVCEESGEFLLDVCQRKGCGNPLSWGGHRGIGYCADPLCEGTAAAPFPSLCSEREKLSLGFAAALINPWSPMHAAARESLPECLHNENRGDLFELAWLLGCLDHPQGPEGIYKPANLSPLTRVQVLASGVERLFDWPNSLEVVLKDGAKLDEDGPSLNKIVASIRAILRKPATFGRPSVLFAAQLEGISTNRFSTALARRLNLLTARGFTRAARLTCSQMANLQRSSYLPRLVFSEGARDIALFWPSDAENIRLRVKGRLSAQAFGSMTGLGISGVELLVRESVLLLDHDPVVEVLYPGTYLNRRDAVALWERLDEKLSFDPAPDNSVPLYIALYGCAPGDKPWPAIVNGVLEGRLRLHRATNKVDLRSCLIDSNEVAMIRAMRVPHCNDVRSEWLSATDAKEFLSISDRTLLSLVRAGSVSSSGRFAGATYRRAEIDQVATKWVSTLELQAKLNLTRRSSLFRALKSVGLVANEHRLVPRATAQEKLGLPLL